MFERAFEEYGLPEVIRSDSGPPFAATGVTGLTALGVWWTKLGIRPRAHRSGQAAAERPPRALPPDAARGDAAARRRPRRPGGALRGLRARLQRGAAARGSRGRAAGPPLHSFAAQDAGAAAGARTIPPRRPSARCAPTARSSGAAGSCPSPARSPARRWRSRRRESGDWLVRFYARPIATIDRTTFRPRRRCPPAGAPDRARSTTLKTVNHASGPNCQRCIRWTAAEGAAAISRSASSEAPPHPTPRKRAGPPSPARGEGNAHPQALTFRREVCLIAYIRHSPISP